MTDVEGDGIQNVWYSRKSPRTSCWQSKLCPNNFLRSDTTSSPDFGLRIKNNSGVEVGLSGTLKLSVEGQAGVLSHQTAGLILTSKLMIMA